MRGFKMAPRRGIATRCVVVAALLAAFTTAPEPSRPADDTKDVADVASEILDAYHSADPQPADRRLHIICWRAKDREFPAGHRDRLDRILTHIEGFYADEMGRLGFGRRSIRPARDAGGRIVIHEVVGEGGFSEYGTPDGGRIR